MNDLTLVVVGKDRESLGEFEAPKSSAVLIYVANVEGRSLAAIANEHLRRCVTPVFGLCHADVVFGPGALDAFAVEAVRGHVCGVVGRTLDGIYRCSYNHERDAWWTDGVHVAGAGPVSTLDGMAVFFPRIWAVLKENGPWPAILRFDEHNFDGFHCHVEDLCLQAQAQGIQVTVPAADAHHRNHAQTVSFLSDYQRYRARLVEKWKGTEFATT